MAMLCFPEVVKESMLKTGPGELPTISKEHPSRMHFAVKLCSRTLYCIPTDVVNSRCGIAVVLPQEAPFWSASCHCHHVNESPQKVIFTRHCVWCKEHDTQASRRNFRFVFVHPSPCICNDHADIPSTLANPPHMGWYMLCSI